MRQKLLLIVFLVLMGSMPALAQSVTITGSVVDANGRAYANGTGSVNLLPSATGWTINGTPVAQVVWGLALDGSGSFSISIPSTSAYDQQNESPNYTFNFCSSTFPVPPYSTKQSCFSVVALVLTSTQSITTQINSNVISMPQIPGSNVNGAAGSGTVTNVSCVTGCSVTSPTTTPAITVTASGSLSGMTAGQIPIAATASTVTSSGNLSGDVTTSNSLAATVVRLNGVSLASLASGLLFNTTTTGVPSIATAAQILTACTGCAPLASPSFTGTVTLPTTNVPTGVTLTIQSGGTLTCSAGSTCPSGSGPGTGTQYEPAYWATGSTLGSAAFATTPNGVPQSLVMIPSGSALTAPVGELPGVVTRQVSGTTSTDTILSTDCNPGRTSYQTSVAVAVTLPTPTTLGVPDCVFRVANNTSGSATALTVTPTTWTVRGGSSITIAQGQVATFYVDPAGSNWEVDIADEPIVAGSNITITRGQYGPTIASTLAAQYAKLRCEPGLGDGLNAIPAGTYLQFNCVNTSGVTWTITGISCWTDNAGTSSLNAANNAATGLLTGAVTCNNTKSGGGAAGTQSGTTTLANNDAISFTFVADGTSKQATFTVSLTQ